MARTRPGEICARSTSRTEAMAAPFPPNHRCCGSHPARRDMSMGSIAVSDRPSEVVVESLLALAIAEQGPDGGGLLQGEPHLGGRSLPERSLVAEHLVHLVGLLRVDPQLRERQMEDRLLGRVGIEAHRAQHHACEIGGRLRIEEDAIVVRLVESQISIKLQRRVLLADSIELRDPLPDVAGLFPLAVDELVLLRVEVLLLARNRLVLAMAEPRVDAPGGGAGRGPGPTPPGRWPPALLPVLGGGVRGVWAQ